MDDPDYRVVLGFDGAGNVKHVSHTNREYAIREARQIRRHYASVRVVTYDKAMRLIDTASEERRRQRRLQGD